MPEIPGTNTEVSVQEVAKALNCSDMTVTRMIRDGDLHARRFNPRRQRSRWLISRASFEAFVADATR